MSYFNDLWIKAHDEIFDEQIAKGVPVAVAEPIAMRDAEDRARSEFYFWAGHFCARCSDGARSCVLRRYSDCEYPHARND